MNERKSIGNRYRTIVVEVGEDWKDDERESVEVVSRYWQQQDHSYN